MKYPKTIYAIYVFDENGDVIGVYVGSSENVKQRILAHRTTTKAQQELHELMRKNGFNFQLLGVINEYEEAHLEYDWVDFFTHMGVKVFNTLKYKNVNWKRLITDYSVPVWNGKSVTYRLREDLAQFKKVEVIK